MYKARSLYIKASIVSFRWELSLKGETEFSYSQPDFGAFSSSCQLILRPWRQLGDIRTSRLPTMHPSGSESAGRYASKVTSRGLAVGTSWQLTETTSSWTNGRTESKQLILSPGNLWTHPDASCSDSGGEFPPVVPKYLQHRSADHIFRRGFCCRAFPHWCCI